MVRSSKYGGRSNAGCLRRIPNCLSPVWQNLSISGNGFSSSFPFFYVSPNWFWERKRMARGKIQIKRIENPTNKQVTYSKRRKGLFKKAEELTVLCDTKVSIIMFSSTGKLHEYASRTTTTKELVDHYQRESNTDLWSSQYEKMQESLTKLKEVNKNLRTQIRQRVGECLNDLNFEELLCLEQDMEDAVKVIWERKYKVLDAEYQKHKKKFKNEGAVHRRILQEFEVAAEEDPHYGLVDDGGGYDSMTGFSNGVPQVFAVRLIPNQPHLAGAVPDLRTYPLLE